MDASEQVMDAQRKPVAVRLLLGALRPRFAIPLCILFAGLSGVAGYRSYQVAGIPDLGDPFDVAAFRANFDPPAETAMADYRAAVDAMTDESFDFDGFPQESWVEVSPEMRAWLATNRASLQRWRDATRKPASFTEVSEMHVTDQERFLERIGIPGAGTLMESIEAQTAGNDVEAIARALPAFRFGTQVEEAAGFPWGTVIRLSAGTVISRSLSGRGLPDEELQRLFEIVQNDVLQAVPQSHFVKWRYVEALRHLEDDPECVMRFAPGEAKRLRRGRLFLANEPERTRRILRQAYWNVLEHIDQPLHLRLVRNPDWPDQPFYTAGARNRLSPAALNEHVENADWNRVDEIDLGWLVLIDKFYLTTRATDRILLTLIAVHIFDRREGRFPESLAELVTAGILAEVPADPFGGAGESLRYRHTDDEVVIWSRGIDRIDDGVAAAPTHLFDSSEESGFDIALRSHRHPPAWAELPAAAFD